MVGLDRLELSTSPLSGVRSNHLSYRPGQEAVPELQAQKTHSHTGPITPKVSEGKKEKRRRRHPANAVVSDQ